MFRAYPSTTKITTQVGGSQNEVRLNLQWDTQDVPEDIEKWLLAAGWTGGNYCPDTNQELFTNFEKTKNTSYFFWYEAVSYEYFWMMTIGGM